MAAKIRSTVIGRLFTRLRSPSVAFVEARSQRDPSRRQLSGDDALSGFFSRAGEAPNRLDLSPVDGRLVNEIGRRWYARVNEMMSVHGERLEAVARELQRRDGWLLVPTTGGLLYVQVKRFWNGSGVFEARWGTKETGGGEYRAPLGRRAMHTPSKVARYVATAITHVGSTAAPTDD